MKRGVTLSITREGFFFIGLTFLFGISSINTGVNLLYLLFSMTLAFIILSGILTSLNLGKIHLVRKVPEYACCGEEVEVEVEFFNEKKRIPSFLLKMREEWEEKSKGLIQEKSNLYALCPIVAPMNKNKGSYLLETVKRGELYFSDFAISTRFPFGFFEKSWHFSQLDSMLIYPRIYAVQKTRDQEGDAPLPFSFMSFEKQEGEFQTLREYVSGDSLRSIHWKSSARQGYLMVRQHEPQRPKKIFLLLHPWETDNAEELISLAASLLSHFSREHFWLGLYVETALDPIYFPPAPDQIDLLLKTLALLKLENPPSSLSPDPSIFSEGEWRIGIVPSSFSSLPNVDLKLTEADISRVLELDGLGQ